MSPVTCWPPLAFVPCYLLPTSGSVPCHLLSPFSALSLSLAAPLSLCSLSLAVPPTLDSVPINWTPPYCFYLLFYCLSMSWGSPLGRSGEIKSTWPTSDSKALFVLCHLGPQGWSRIGKVRGRDRGTERQPPAQSQRAKVDEARLCFLCLDSWSRFLLCLLLLCWFQSTENHNR